MFIFAFPNDDHHYENEEKDFCLGTDVIHLRDGGSAELYGERIYYRCGE